MPQSSDPLDNEVSLSVDIKETGVTAKSKSRLISGLDRLVGNFADWANVRLEEGITARRAVMTSKQKIIEAATEAIVHRIAEDPALAERALRTHSEEILRSQQNREGVAKKAIEDLVREPPSRIDSSSGPEQMTPELMDRLQTFASGASTEELQERWGRIFAAEVRRPGTFSLKVLRIIDELEQDVARIFENFVENRVGSYIPKILSGKLAYSHQMKLVDAGLLVDPGLGQSTSYLELELDDKYWGWTIENEIICLRQEDFKPERSISSEKAVSTHNEKPAVPVYILTPAGHALTTILPPVNNSKVYFEKVKVQYPTATRWKIADDGKSASKIE